MSGKTQSSPPVRRKQPLHGVVIFVSQQLVSNRGVLHQLCTSLGGKFVWVFDVPFTHYICQGKLSKRAKEYKKAEEYRAKCVHPAWLKACHSFGQRVAEKLYASTYDPNRSLSFISAGDDDDEDEIDDEDEENHIPSLTTVKSSSTEKANLHKRIISAPPVQKQQVNIPTKPSIQSPAKLPIPSPQVSSQLSNEAETMLNDLESSLAQFLNNNNHQTSFNPSSSRPSTINDDESNRKSLSKIRSISNNLNTNQSHDTTEPSMRVEWLDDAMQAERKKITDEDECTSNSQNQSQSQNQKRNGQKRPLIDSNSEQSFKNKKSRI